MTIINLTQYVRRLARSGAAEQGQALGELSLVLAFVALVCIIALTAIGLAVGVPYEQVSAAMGFGGGS